MALNLYRVTGRAPASVIFRRGDSLSINYVRDGIKGTISFSTRYNEAIFSVPVPGDFCVVIEAEAENVNEASTWITVGREIASIIALSTNAAVAPLKGELIYEITPGKLEREFFQRFTPSDSWNYSSRTVPLEGASAILSAIALNDQRNRILRATTQYNEALLLWEQGNELLVIAHLWMGIEAIKKACLRLHLKERCINKEDLAVEWGFDPSRFMKLDQFLDAEARLRLACQGDALHHRIAKQVSDRFEHGLANGGALFASARDALIPIATYLRQAIIKVSGIAHDVCEVVLNSPYDRPRGLGGPEYYFRTTLVGAGEDLSDFGLDHPIFDWRYHVEKVTLNEETWTYKYSPQHTFTARIGKHIKAVGGRVEIWDGGTYTPKSAAERLEAENTTDPRHADESKTDDNSNK